MKKKDWQRRLDDVIKVCNNITIKHALTAQKAELKAKFKKVMDDTPFIGADAFCYKINVQKQIEAL